MSTETMNTETTTPNLSAINPLIDCDTWDEDTAANVRGALLFLADAIPAIEIHGGGFDRETANGFCKLIKVCVAAMEVTKG